MARLVTALSVLTSVPASGVDVAEQDVIDRNWDAAVLATYEAVPGDVSWSLNVYLSEAVDKQPTEAQVARFLADALAVPVLYPAESYPPSAYWLVSPGESPTRARVYDGQGEDEDLIVIDAVGRPVPSLPHVRVEAQPEVIRSYSLVTPVSDRFSAWLVTQLAGPDLPGDATWHARNRLGAWENLTVRMASGWPPDGWYPTDYYRDDLTIRDELAATGAGWPAEQASRFAAALTELDDAFRAGTREADLLHLTRVLGEEAGEISSRGWWWRRLPDPEPWDPPR
ncbi:hypothetical protein [Actinoplanes sp. NPDC049599]|uniref:hypothetical protein n=1 Tax=Actinoplanes sp. NPDC049599 TaxID=3363903 RepID=UPI00379ADEB0